MRRSFVVLNIALIGVLFAGVGGTARAETASPKFRSASCAGAVDWRNARRVIGRVATIRGYVAGAKYASSSNGSPTFLNLGVDYPSSRRVTVVIWDENRARFGRPESRYLRRTICVRGFVDTYAGVPDIEATSPSQIALAR
jgi:hypothetical protein